MTGPRVAWLTGEYPRATDTFIQREVAALRAMGFDVVTCTVRPTDAVHHVSPAIAAEAARTFAILPVLRRPGRALASQLAAMARPGRWLQALALSQRTAPRGVRGRVYNLIYLAEAAVLARHLRAQGVVHLHNHIAKSSGTVAMLAAHLAGISHSFTLHGPDDLAEPAHWALGEKIARADFVACISDYARAQAMLACGREHWSKLHVIHCGVEPELYDRPGARPGDRLLFVGRLAAVKGVPLLLQALAVARGSLPGLRLTLVGDGPERAALEAEAAGLGLGAAVEFLGYRGQEEVAALLAQVDALVLPSFAEGVPVVLMEAMAAGLPVIATRVAGVPELVEDGHSGLLVPPGDEVALAGAITALMGDAGTRGRMGAAGRAAVRAGFDSREEAARLAALVLGAVARDPRLPRRPAPVERRG